MQILNWYSETVRCSHLQLNARDAVKSRSWALKERADGKKLHVQVKYLTLSVMQKDYMNPESEPIARCTLTLRISSVGDSEAIDNLIFDEMAKFGCPRGKCQLGGAAQTAKQTMPPMKVRSTVHKMVVWEATVSRLQA
jgi:hypothetical protein